jgi:hypothetical protein
MQAFAVSAAPRRQHPPVGRAMTSRQIQRYTVPAIGTLHFAVALCWWCVLVFQVVGLRTLVALPRSYLLSQIVYPIASCLVLLTGFCVSLFFTQRNSRHARRAVFAVLVLIAVLFTVGAGHTAAQVHYFGPPGTNHFYATWWLYSQFPPLSIACRALVSVTFVFAATALFCYWNRVPDSCRPTIQDLKSAGVDADRD